MKEYNLYVPWPAVNGDTQNAAGSWRWLEDLLTTQFGQFQSALAKHEGNTAGFTFQGTVKAISILAEENKARPFFKHLKQEIKKQGRPEVLILETDAPGPKGELAGERI